MTTHAANKIPVRRLFWMPWRWHQWSLHAVAAATIVWLLFYVVSYPVVQTWQGYGAFRSVIEIVDDAVIAASSPLDFCTENSEVCFSLYVWELRLLHGSSATAWMLPKPVPVTDIYLGCPMPMDHP